MTTVDGVSHIPNLPTEEVFTAPDPQRADGVVTATKPLDVSGTLVAGCAIRFEGGRAVEIEAESGADALRARCAQGRGRVAPRRARARRPRGPHRQDGHRLLQHAARRERRQPPRARQRLRDLGRRGGPRPDQQERDPHRLHGRQRRCQRDRADARRRARCRSYAAAAGRSETLESVRSANQIRSFRGGARRAPDAARGSPRSANGTSITSKSRGTTVAAKTACASRASSGPK